MEFVTSQKTCYFRVFRKGVLNFSSQHFVVFKACFDEDLIQKCKVVLHDRTYYCSSMLTIYYAVKKNAIFIFASFDGLFPRIIEI